MDRCAKCESCYLVAGNPYPWQNPCPCKDYVACVNTANASIGDGVINMDENDKEIVEIAMNLLYDTISGMGLSGLHVVASNGLEIDGNAVYLTAKHLGIDLN